MSHFESCRVLVNDAPCSDAREFARALLGLPNPRPDSCEAASRFRRESLRRLAGLSDYIDEELRAFANAETDMARRRKSLEWAALISPEAAEKLRLLRRGEVSQAGATWPALAQTYDHDALHEWNEADHPRQAKGSSKGGQWTSKGGGTSGDSAKAPRSRSRAHLPDPERARTRIQGISGEKWSGDRVLGAIGALAPEWLPFVKQHLSVAMTSGQSQAATATVHSGEFGPPIKNLPRGPLRDLGPLTVRVEIPAGWNDVQAAQFILDQLANDIDVHRLAADWATGKPDLFKGIQDQRFRDGLPTIAALAGGYYSAIASLLPGTGAVMAAWDIQNGDTVGAALGVAFMLPLGSLLKKGLEATGSIALKTGDQIIGVLPIKVIERVQKLTPDQQSLLIKRLLAATNEQEAAEITAKFLAEKFDRHHPLAKFLGGHPNQFLSRIPREVHHEFHRLLREELRAAGLNLPIGGVTGSTQKWIEYLGADSVRQRKAFDAILKASRAIDAKHGTEITSKVWENLTGQKFFLVPRP